LSESDSASSIFSRSRRPFLVRKLHSLTGIVPVGGFLLFHLWTNAKALQGREQFDAAVSDISHMPYVAVLEFGVILLPLAFHALYGVKLALEAKPNNLSYAYTRNWMYTLQRVTGILAFAFIVFHLYEYWAPKWMGTMAEDEFYPALCANMSATVRGVPVNALIYIVGIGASVFHFANGLWAFCFSWGLTVSRRSQRLSAAVFGAIGVILFLLGANTAIYFATGSRVAPFGKAAGSTGEHMAQTCADVTPASKAPPNALPVDARPPEVEAP
jgi:succinate dehydrogenase/fumarate reductase cytochrome b subunit (b558 family)